MRRAFSIAAALIALASVSFAAEAPKPHAAQKPDAAKVAAPKVEAVTASFDRAVRDPFNFSGAGPVQKTDKPKQTGYTLEGIVWMSDRPQAIVNGKIVERGSKLDNAEILDIDEKGVKMRVDGKELLLKPRGQN